MAILNQRDWDDAASKEHLTLEHVVGRLEDIAVHEFGNEGSIGFDERGFLVSLTAASRSVDGGIKLSVFPNDHPPPHVHVIVKARPGVKIRVRLDTGELMDSLPPGIPRKKFRYFCQVVEENRELLVSWWEKYQGSHVATT